MRKFLFLLIFLPLTASAYDAEIDGVYYNLDKNTNQAEVTYPTSPSDHYKYSGDIIIAESFTYDGIHYKVTSIGKSTFDMCFGLTSVIIPNSIISIGMGAFYDCSSLSTVTIPNSVTWIGNAAFFDCTGMTSIVVENGNPKYDSRDNCNAIIETATNTVIGTCSKSVIPDNVVRVTEPVITRDN